MRKKSKRSNRPQRRARASPKRQRGVGLREAGPGQPRFGVMYSANGSSSRMRGAELVGDVYSSENALSGSVSCNPTTWVGTRVGSIAATYSTYQLNSLRVKFVPSVAATEGGLIVGGTNWDDGNLDALSMRSLSGTNGGCSGNVYKSLTVTPSLGGLMQPRFQTDLSKPESEPFRFAFITSGVSSEKVVGHLYVEYDITCYNPSPGSSYVIDAGRHDITLKSSLVGDPVTVEIVDDEAPQSIIVTEDFVVAGKKVLRAGVRYALEAAGVVGEYVLKEAYETLRDTVGVTAPAVLATYLYSQRLPALGFR